MHTGCSSPAGNTGSENTAQGAETMIQSITVRAAAFGHNEPIPSEYTCQGENYSPEISWTPVSNAVSYALICDDPDAPNPDGFVHWVVFNIPPDATTLAKSLPTDEPMSNGAVQGENSYRKSEYDGPCPPKGTHRYFFKVYALDTMVDLDSSARRDDFLDNADGHIIGYGELIGTYKKQ